MSLISDLRNEKAHLDLSRRAIRKFIILMSLICAVFMVIAFRHKNFQVLIILLAPEFYLLTGYFVPRVIIPVYKIWMLFAALLGWIISRLILVALFFIIITPYGIAARLFRKQFLDLSFDRASTTYWKQKQKAPVTDYRKIF